LHSLDLLRRDACDLRDNGVACGGVAALAPEGALLPFPATSSLSHTHLSSLSLLAIY
jgi:hypothetical protein